MQFSAQNNLAGAGLYQQKSCVCGSNRQISGTWLAEDRHKAFTSRDDLDGVEKKKEKVSQGIIMHLKLCFLNY